MPFIGSVRLVVGRGLNVAEKIGKVGNFQWSKPWAVWRGSAGVAASLLCRGARLSPELVRLEAKHKTLKTYSRFYALHFIP